MNLYKLARFVILIWLPLAASKPHDESQLNYLLSDEKKSDVGKHEEESTVENITETLEENPLKKQKNKSMPPIARNPKPPEYFPAKNCANSSFLESENNVNSKGNLTSAHKHSDSVKKDQSALNIYSTVKNKRGAKFKGQPENTGGPKVRKRKAALEISTGEDPHSLEDYEEEEAEEITTTNTTELGSYVGAACESTCSEKLLHVVCEPTNKVCECEKTYPVQINPEIGCERPKQLGDQCFYEETCSFFDPNSVCTQIDHNAICQCKPGYHTVALRRGVKRVFCSEDISLLSTDLTTFLGVATGIAVLTGLICFVLRLFNGRNSNTRHYANAHIAPPLLFSSDNQWINGIPLTVHGRPPSRSSCQRSTTSLAQYSRGKGVLVPASRAGAARAAAILLIPCHLQASRQSEVTNNSIVDDSEVQPNDVEQTSRLGSRRHSLSSVQSTTSSQKSMSYSARRFEQENQQREQRAAIRAAREEAARSTVSFTPSPMSTDGLAMPFSKDTEEDPLCAHAEHPLPESEPPALSINQALIQPKVNPHN